MTTAATSPTDHGNSVPALTARQTAFDILVAVVCLALTLTVNLGGSESVSANRDPDALTVALTVLAVGSIALRRRYPLATLAVALAAILGLVLVKGTVGMATIGPFAATYTAVTLGNARSSRRAIGLVIVALALTAILDPVDLSREGAILSSAAFAAVILSARPPGPGGRGRRPTSALRSRR